MMQLAMPLRKWSPSMKPLTHLSILAVIAACLTTHQTAFAQNPQRLSTNSTNVSAAPTAPSQQASASTVTWLAFEDCPVLLENTVEVPAQDAGVLRSLDVQVNQTVTKDQVLARLNEDKELTELKLLQQQHLLAVEQAADDGQFQFSKNVLQSAEENLDNHRAISQSVAASELQRLKLEVGKAKVDVQRAERALKVASMQADVVAASVQAANVSLQRRRVIAPTNGVVTEIKVKAGQWVEAGKTTMVISNMEQMIVDVLVPLEKVDLTRIVGLEVRVESEHRPIGETPLRLAGKIISYDPRVSSQGKVRVHARIQNAQRDGHGCCWKA